MLSNSSFRIFLWGSQSSSSTQGKHGNLSKGFTYGVSPILWTGQIEILKGSRTNWGLIGNVVPVKKERMSYHSWDLKCQHQAVLCGKFSGKMLTVLKSDLTDSVSAATDSFSALFRSGCGWSPGCTPWWSSLVRWRGIEYSEKTGLQMIS